MKFAMFRRGRSEHLGLLARDDDTGAPLEVVDLTEAGVARDLVELIGNFDGLRARLAELRDAGPTATVASDELLAPIPRPVRNIFCVGKNYREHAREFASSGFDSAAASAIDVPADPIVFSKPPSCVIGTGQPIPRHLDPTDSVDYEGEFAVIVGRSGRVGVDDDPMDYVFGYTLLNDVTAREMQKRHKQWLLGKGIDGFCPMGPIVACRDALGALAGVRLETYVNDELRQSATLAELIFDVPTLVATIGRSISLQVGDVIATGTPAGVGIGFNPPRYLRRADRVRIQATGLGVLENPVS